MSIQREMLAIEKTYYHRMKIERMMKVVTEDGLTKGNKPQIVIENVPCALSFNRMSQNTTQSDGPNMIEYAAILFCNPKTNIVTGDTLHITLENGHVRKLQAGEPIPYPTHFEVPCGRKEGA